MIGKSKRETEVGLLNRELKECIKCGIVLPYTREFFPTMVRRKLRSHCKPCNSILNKERRELKKQYGIPPAGYRCPVCNRGEEELLKATEGKSLWSRDHDHEDKNFRGFLCHPCNRALGILQDNPDILLNGYKYLMNAKYN